MKLTLAKTLKYLKRVKERLAIIDQEMATHNSRDSEVDQVVDVRALYEERKKLVAHIIQVKMALEAGSQPVRWQILQVAELKGELTLLRGLDTASGPQPLVGYREESRRSNVAVITKSEVDERVMAITEDLDGIQEGLDRHNYSTEVEIPDLG